MNPQQLSARLLEELNQLEFTCQSIESAAFFKRIMPEKWSPAENVHHLMLAVRPLRLAFSLPYFVLRLFGRPNRPARSYEEVVSRYQEKLNQGAKASLPYVPTRKFSVSKAKLLQQIHHTYTSWSKIIETIPDEKLDRYLLPHPILGKITLREMVYFTIYHLHHHHRIIKNRV